MQKVLAGILVAGLVGAAAAEAEGASRLDRPGTVALGGGGGYGLVTGEGRYGLDFGGGGNYHLQLKYMIAPRWAFGFRFENQSLGWEDGIRDEKNQLVEGQRYEGFKSTTFEGHLYYYRGRNADASPYVTAGFGIYRPELAPVEGTTVFPGDNVMLSAGIGSELFLRENWALDLTVRGAVLFGRGYADGELQAFDKLDSADYLRQQVEDMPDASFALQLTVGLLYFVPR